MADSAAPVGNGAPAVNIPPTVPPAQVDAGQAIPQHALTVVVPNLRNGVVADITQAAPRASIPSKYKWCHITGMTNAGMISSIDAVIRAQYSQLLSANGANVTDADRTTARTAAIVLGSVRAGAASAFQLVQADFNQEELAASGSSYTEGANGQPGRIVSGGGTAGGKFTIAQGMAPLTNDEVSVINAVVYLGMAVPAMQGISLVLTGHHYLPSTKNHFMGMKRQALQVCGDVARTWIEALGDTFDDLAFHKACHPISPPAKRRWAKDPELAVRMTASGHTAAAIRIPALPSDAQGAKAALAVVVKAAPVIRGMTHTVSWANGEGYIRAVESAPEGREELAAVSNARNWLVTNASPIAFCIGIVQYLSDSSGGTRDTTLQAYSVRKLAGDNSAEVSRGLTYARAYMNRIREQAADGSFPDPNFSL